MALRLPGFFKLGSAAEKSNALEKRLWRAEQLRSANCLAEAKALCQENLLLQSHHVGSLRMLADIATQSQDVALARDAYTKLILATPTDAHNYYKRGNLLMDSNDLTSALSDYELAIKFDSSHANAFCNRGVVLERLDRFDEAFDSLSRAIYINSRDALAHYNRASILRKLNDHERALESYDQAVLINPAYFEAWCNRGALLIELKRWDAASRSLEQSIALEPRFGAAYFNRAALHHKRGRREEALADYDRSIALSQNLAAAYAGRGILLAELARNDSALVDFQRAIALNPGQSDAYIGQADVLFQNRQFEAAIASYDKALSFDPDTPYLLGMRCHARMNLCEWAHYERDLSRLTYGINGGKPVTKPFPVLAMLDSAKLQLAVAVAYVQKEYPQDSSLGTAVKRVPGERIRVGYFSADFREHPVALLMAELFELHDRERFEIFAFAFGPESNDLMQARLQQGFDRFIDVRRLSDAAVAALAREIGIDIAVDLGGFTAYSRTGIFALRAAPVQLSYIGYLGTSGAPYMDYLIADETIIPLGTEQYYSEKIIYLPSYQANDSKRRMSEHLYTREELGLPSSGFIFCCFNAAYKITPPTFELWMRILRRVPNSTLFLYVRDDEARKRLVRCAEDLGIDGARIVFAAHMSLAEYMARFRTMNLFLDTLTYNAGTTASDALWSGLPVLTCAGQAFAARVAASLLTALELPELITSTVFEYEELAVKLATDEQLIAQISAKVSNNRSNAALFDARRFIVHLECAFTQIHVRAEALLPPEHIYIKAGS